jgi:hypothetical protein
VDVDCAAAAFVVGDLFLLELAEDDSPDLLLEALEGTSPTVVPDTFKAALLLLLWLLTTQIGRRFLREGIEIPKYHHHQWRTFYYIIC